MPLRHLLLVVVFVILRITIATIVVLIKDSRQFSCLFPQSTHTCPLYANGVSSSIDIDAQLDRVSTKLRDTALFAEEGD